MVTKILQKLGTTQYFSDLEGYVELMENTDEFKELLKYFENPTFTSVGVKQPNSEFENVYYIWTFNLKPKTTCPKQVIEDLKDAFDDDNQPRVVSSMVMGTLTIFQEVWE